MNEHTKKLLEECDSGCKMAINSIYQVEPHAKGDDFKNLLGSYKQKHEKLERECEALLYAEGEEKKEPGLAATTFSWITTQMKLTMHEDNAQIAKLMMDGCNMGIQKISEYQNDFHQAEPEALAIARKLVKIEEDYMQEMKSYL